MNNNGDIPDAPNNHRLLSFQQIDNLTGYHSEQLYCHFHTGLYFGACIILPYSAEVLKKKMRHVERFYYKTSLSRQASQKCPTSWHHLLLSRSITLFYKIGTDLICISSLINFQFNSCRNSQRKKKSENCQCTGCSLCVPFLFMKEFVMIINFLKRLHYTLIIDIFKFFLSQYLIKTQLNSIYSLKYHIYSCHEYLELILSSLLLVTVENFFFENKNEIQQRYRKRT